ncbi:MAG: efflux RND transporter periplasmic adaptor subunit [Rhizobacter sp.]
MTSRFSRFAALVFVAVLAACSKKEPPPPPKPATVGVFTVTAGSQAISTELPGRTKARLIAEIRPQVGGIVLRRLFEEGARVKAGQVLYELDPATFRAAVTSAEAGVSKATATLGSARTTAARDAELVKIDAISQQQRDTSQAAAKQAEADLEVARAALQTARINLDRTRIASPIDGFVSVSTVTPGALVTANQEAALTTVQQLDPLYVDVVQSSAELLRLKRELADGTLQQRQGNADAPFKLVLEDGTPYAHPGRLKFSGVAVNPATGAVTLRGEIPNPDNLLMPGMYVRAQLETGVADQAILVPQQGVTRTPSGEASAWVIGAGNKVEARKLTVDRAIRDKWQVTAGLKPGDRVIVDGLQRTRVGATVNPVDASASAPARGASAPAASAASR